MVRKSIVISRHLDDLPFSSHPQQRITHYWKLHGQQRASLLLQDVYWENELADYNQPPSLPPSR